VRIRSLQGALSSRWLTAVPTHDSLRIATSELRLALRWYLGLPMPGIGGQGDARCVACNQLHHPDGHHAFPCSSGQPLRTQRHTDICELLRAYIRRSGRSVQREPQIQHRPPLYLDLVVTHNDGRMDTLVDAAVTHPVAASYMRYSLRPATGALDFRYRKNTRKYGAASGTYLSERHPASLVSTAWMLPFILDVCGQVDSRAHAWLRYLFPAVTAPMPSLLTALSVLLWRYNGRELAQAGRRVDSGSFSSDVGGSANVP